MTRRANLAAFHMLLLGIMMWIRHFIGTSRDLFVAMCQNVDPPTGSCPMTFRFDVMSAAHKKRSSNSAFGYGRPGFSVFLNHFDPKSKRQIFPGRHSQLPSQFGGIAIIEDVKIQRDARRKEANIIAILLSVPFELR